MQQRVENGLGDHAATRPIGAGRENVRPIISTLAAIFRQAAASTTGLAVPLLSPVGLEHLPDHRQLLLGSRR
jgi:hypothetical protein